MSSGQENKRKKRDGCWQYVIETAPGISICKFCGHKFGKGTSVSRIKLHLSGAKSLGVKICQKVPENIRRAGIGSVKKRCEATSIPTNGRVVEMMITNSRGEANNEAPVDQGEIFLHEEDGNIVGSRDVLFTNCNIGERGVQLRLPRDTKRLKISECHDLQSLCDASPSLNGAIGLKSVNIEQCDGIQCLLQLSCLSSYPEALKSLESLSLWHLKSLKVLFSRGGDVAPAPWPPTYSCFPHLKTIWVVDCPRLKVLFPLGLAVNLPNLEEIKVLGCKELEELVESREGGEEQQQGTRNLQNNYFSHLKTIEVEGCSRLKVLFPLGLPVNLSNLEKIKVSGCNALEELVESSEGGEEEEEEGTRTLLLQFSLPKLETLQLLYLPELKRICGGSSSITCNSIEYIRVVDCPKLKRMPISLPLLDNGRPSPPPSLFQFNISPKEWWDSVEWDHPQAEEVLRPLCFLRDEGCYLTEWSSSRGDEDDITSEEEKSGLDPSSSEVMATNLPSNSAADVTTHEYYAIRASQLENEYRLALEGTNEDPNILGMNMNMMPFGGY
ncbi:hypothetical protein Tsubulata_013530 [Turnera subulata]|uniref:Disease resistance protein At4g27190-like leucine-rich repeats domain-containing protein n=1 Tax=Turnera subulata TaxID=218843 RepID=A0A9Q0GCI3_9ROSI|nr:hypothetical protein Tsubulata_013530 [Turnera subulata]